MNPVSTTASTAAGPGIDQARGMQGFDAEFRDLDHYIRVITERIWEGGRIDDIYRYYGDPCIVETPAGVTTRVQQVVDGTRATLAMFPDRRLLAEDIIVSGDEAGGLLSSHRIISTMTHRGDGVFGPASGRPVHARTIADCVCKDNRIIHEWLVRDQGAIALQVGIEPRQLAQTWLDQRGGWNKPQAGPAPAGYRSHVGAEALARAYAQAIQDFAAGHFSGAIYDQAVHHLGPCEATRYGRVEVLGYWQRLFGSLQVASFQVEHLALQRGGGRPERVALRWRARATHNNHASAQAPYGPASGRSVEIMGINHAEFVDGRALREWVLVDDVALWMQVLEPRA